MSTISRYKPPQKLNRDEPEQTILLAYGVPVGAIEALEDGSYEVRTKGLVPALEGITGRTAEESWGKTGERVRSGSVSVVRKILFAE